MTTTHLNLKTTDLIESKACRGAVISHCVTRFVVLIAHRRLSQFDVPCVGDRFKRQRPNKWSGQPNEHQNSKCNIAYGGDKAIADHQWGNLCVKEKKRPRQLKKHNNSLVRLYLTYRRSQRIYRQRLRTTHTLQSFLFHGSTPSWRRPSHIKHSREHGGYEPLKHK